MPSLDPLTMSRLALIRLLYIQGVSQAKLPAPLIYTSVLTLHDTVELFLGLAADHLGASLPDHLQFLKYWTELHPNKLGTNGVDLPGKNGMDRLNRLRNGFKHAGTLPGVPAVEQAHAETTAFLEDATPLVFGVPFGDIDMADVVSQAYVRDKLKQAAGEWSAGSTVEGMASLVEAFRELFAARTRPKWMGESPFSFGRDELFPTQKHSYQRLASHVDELNRHYAREILEEAFRVSEATRRLQLGMRVTAIGIDYAQYYRFVTMTPDLGTDREGKREAYHADAYAPRGEDFDWCRQFVILAALRCAEIDAQVDGLPTSSRAAGAPQF